MDEVRSQPTIKLGLMGFGQIGRMIYQLAQHQPDIEITAIADIGEPHILCYLLQAELNDPASFRLEGSRRPHYQSRMLRTDSPGEVPWDTFGVDLVIEATGQFGTVLPLKPTCCRQSTGACTNAPHRTH